MSRRIGRGSTERASGVNRIHRGEEIASVVAVARLWHEAGYAVLPSHEDGTESPSDQHRTYQGTRPDWAELEGWLRSGRYPGVGVLTGAISGNAEMIEIAGPPGRALATVTALLESANELGTRSLLSRIWNGCTEQSAEGGIRSFIRVAGGRPLCSRPLAVDQAGSPAAWARGEGDFVIVGSIPSTRPRPPDAPVHALVEDRLPSMTVTVSPEERDALHLRYARARIPEHIQPKATQNGGHEEPPIGNESPTTHGWDCGNDIGATLNTVPPTDEEEPLPPAMECADCAQVAVIEKVTRTESGGYLDHLGGCPAGDEIARASARDRLWFALHPEAETYRRPLMPGDLGLRSLSVVTNARRVRIEVWTFDGFRVKLLRRDDLVIRPGTIDGKYLATVLGPRTDGKTMILDFDPSARGLRCLWEAP